MLKKYFLTNLQGFDLHIAGGYTVSLACSQFLVLTALLKLIFFFFHFCLTDVCCDQEKYLSLFILGLWTVLYKFSRNHHILELMDKVSMTMEIKLFVHFFTSNFYSHEKSQYIT